MLSRLPEELISKIVLDAIILLKNETWREVHEELLLKRITPQTELGCIFLTTNYPILNPIDVELANIDYAHAVRIPLLV
tara:strand:+ start:86 stop:322 length:237 start_codon:yes stop_codon:yes gene_type:complete